MVKHEFSFIFLTFCFFLVGCQPSSDQPSLSYSVIEDPTFDGDIANNGQLLVSSHAQNGVLVYQIPDMNILYHWQHHTEQNNDIFITRFSPDNLYAVTASRTEFTLWRLKDGAAMGFWKISQSTIRDLSVSDQGLIVLIGQSDGQVISYSPRTGKRLAFLGHTDKINSIEVSANGQYAISGGNDYVAYLWRVNDGQVIHRFNHASRVTKVALDHNSQYAFSADSKNQAFIWNLKEGTLHNQLNILSRQKLFSAVRFNQDSTLLLTGSPSRNLDLWDTSSGNKIKNWLISGNQKTKPVSAVVYSAQFDHIKKMVWSFSSAGLLEGWNYTDAKH